MLAYMGAIVVWLGALAWLATRWPERPWFGIALMLIAIVFSISIFASLVDAGVIS